ncbi:MAG: isochorismatase family protein [Pseudorhodoplanes sp.]
MTERIWDKFLTERDKAVLAASGYGKAAGFGRRPAVLVIDVNYAFCGDKPEPILESIKRWRNSCGEEAWKAVAVTKKILDAARGKGLPIIYTTAIRRPDEWDDGGWIWKISRSLEPAPPLPPGIHQHDVVAPIAPQPQDIIVQKQKPSAFGGTNLTSYLTMLQADSLIVTGTTTSGCVRATVIDAFAANFRVALVEDACFDRTEASHAINLFDMDSKYADVIPSSKVLDFIATLPAGMFELPSGIPVGERRQAAE